MLQVYNLVFVAMSTIEAEYMALVEASKEVVFFIELMNKLGIE